MEILCNCSFEKVYDVTVVSDGDAFLSCLLFCCKLEDFVKVIENYIYPALIVSCLDS